MANDINIEASVKACGFELYDVYRPNNSKHTQIQIMHNDRPVEIQDCVLVHKHLLHAGIDIPIEVSTPGLKRNLKTHRHFTLAQSCHVKITTKNGPLMGELKKVCDTYIELSTHSENHIIHFDNIIKARTTLPHEALS